MEYSRIRNTKAKIIHNAFRLFFTLNGRLRLFRFKSWEGFYWSKLSRIFFKDKETLLKNKYGQLFRVRTDQLVDFTAVYGRKGEAQILDIFNVVLKEDSSLIDCGAHIGRYSLIAATIIKKGVIIAIEPFDNNYAMLQQNISINCIPNIKALNVAAASDEGQTELYIGKDYATSTLHINWLKRMDRVSNPASATRVGLVKLDNIIKKYGLEEVTLLKIDCEGAENDVLKGCMESIGNKKVKYIICEIHEPIASRKAIISLLQSYGYSIKNIGESEILAQLTNL